MRVGLVWVHGGGTRAGAWKPWIYVKVYLMIVVHVLHGTVTLTLISPNNPNPSCPITLTLSLYKPKQCACASRLNLSTLHYVIITISVLYLLSHLHRNLCPPAGIACIDHK